MSNTNARNSVRGDPYVTSGPFLPAILERIIGSRWNLIHKTTLFMLVFSISKFRDLYWFHSLHALRNYTPIPAARSTGWAKSRYTVIIYYILYTYFWHTLYMNHMEFHTETCYVAELNACPKECSKLSERLQMDQYGYLRKGNLRIRWSFHRDNLSELNE